MKLTLLFFFLSAALFGQQLSFEELIYYSKDVKKFEQRMFGLGNKIIAIKKSEGYSYSTEGGGFGSSTSESIPTKNPYYDEKWLFPSGETLTSTQIKAQRLDENFEIRKRLRKLGQPLNKDSINGYRYDSHLSEIFKTIGAKSSFGQNYNKENETALTFYTLRVVKREKIYPDKIPYKFWYSNFDIFYVDRDIYLIALREVQAACEYIKTSERYGGQYESEYRYGSYTVKTYEGSEYGGHIEFYVHSE